MKRSEAIKLRQAIEQAVQSLPVEVALEVPQLFRAYETGKAYTKDERFRWNEKLWKVLQPHTSVAHYRPDEAVSLYVEVTPPGVIAAWKQPLGAHDAYQTGAKVTHNGKTWESSVDNNTWEPGVYGWTEI
jgi:hypothetical protein